MTATTRAMEFWFDLASPYAYLSARRIQTLAGADVTVEWRPLVLGAIFKAHGWETSPFVVYPAKGRHMWRDVERRAAAYSTSVRPPRPFPQNSLQAHRLALVGLDQGWGQRFVLDVFECVARAGGDARHAFETAASATIKARLRADTERAAAKGIFGAPSFVVSGELFWGDDRLDEAILWAKGTHPLQSAGR